MRVLVVEDEKNLNRIISGPSANADCSPYTLVSTGTRYLPVNKKDAGLA